MDLRGLSWSDAEIVLTEERKLLERISQADDPEGELELIEEEIGEDPGLLAVMDLGMASTVVALSAAGCIPFTSCNGGASATTITRIIRWWSSTPGEGTCRRCLPQRWRPASALRMTPVAG